MYNCHIFKYFQNYDIVFSKVFLLVDIKHHNHHYRFQTVLSFFLLKPIYDVDWNDGYVIFIDCFVWSNLLMETEICLTSNKRQFSYESHDLDLLKDWKVDGYWKEKILLFLRIWLKASFFLIIFLWFFHSINLIILSKIRFLQLIIEINCYVFS